MASALDPNREATRLARALAERRAGRVPRSRSSAQGWRARRHDVENDPLMSPAAAARLRAALEVSGQ